MYNQNTILNKMTTTNNKPIIGTHNSMTYLRPTHWYEYLIIPFARCQRKTLEQQFWAGARCFDLRIRFTYDGRPYFAHGLYTMRDPDKLNKYSKSPQHALYMLSMLSVRSGEKVYVRLILEDPDQRIHNEVFFRNFCKMVQDEDSEFSYLVYFGGNRKGDWKQIVEFDYKPDLMQYVSSMADDARWYEKFLPFAYAWRKNRENKQNPQGDIAIYDFI